MPSIFNICCVSCYFVA